ncbi:hypothetical protein G5V57_29310 [Nordella sp. HKS 07]|uniref:6-phosphogluconolactonase n=1 Tax=Nordella sp. HKS 07 TaxID=2712222 RepID=UPI0013E12E4B|nr:hypothetical protein [Nordella sp. HKS 07]QIG51456.1 hypothetical protein G5V57_29310 [Nordella sp. HKS 07]
MNAITPQIFHDVDILGRVFAERLLALIDQAKAAGRLFLLGCPGGRSPRPVYQAMGQALAKRPRDLSHLVIVMMDDYLVETGSGLDHVPENSHFSCRRFAQVEIVGVLNEALAEGFRIPAAQVWFPDPRDPQAYDARIAEAGASTFSFSPRERATAMWPSIQKGARATAVRASCRWPKIPGATT